MRIETVLGSFLKSVNIINVFEMFKWYVVVEMADTLTEEYTVISQ